MENREVFVSRGVRETFRKLALVKRICDKYFQEVSDEMVEPEYALRAIKDFVSKL